MLVLSLYGKMQESGLNEIIPLITSLLSGASILFFSILNPLRAHHQAAADADGLMAGNICCLPERQQFSVYTSQLFHCRLNAVCGELGLWIPSLASLFPWVAEVGSIRESCSPYKFLLLKSKWLLFLHLKYKSYEFPQAVLGQLEGLLFQYDVAFAKHVQYLLPATSEDGWVYGSTFPKIWQLWLICLCVRDGGTAPKAGLLCSLLFMPSWPLWQGLSLSHWGPSGQDCSPFADPSLHYPWAWGIPPLQLHLSGPPGPLFTPLFQEASLDTPWRSLTWSALCSVLPLHCLSVPCLHCSSLVELVE